MSLIKPTSSLSSTGICKASALKQTAEKIISNLAMGCDVRELSVLWESQLQAGSACK
jgi:hypothetical protein